MRLKKGGITNERVKEMRKGESTVIKRKRES